MSDAKKKVKIKQKAGGAAPKPSRGRNPEVMAFVDRAVSKPKPKAEAQAEAVPPTADRAPRTGNPTSHKPQATSQTQTHTPLTQRLFYALRVPTNIANPLAEHQRKLKGNWRAVNPGQMHVTLCYLPAVPPDRVEDLKKLGTRLMQDLAPMQIKLRGTGYFPNEGSPRVWFVKVEAEGLNELAEQLRAEVRALGIETEDLPFKAHITLARKKGPAPRLPPITFETGWVASSAALYRSHLRKTGPIYEVESTFRFRGEAVDTKVSPVATSPETAHRGAPPPTSQPLQATSHKPQAASQAPQEQP